MHTEVRSEKVTGTGGKVSVVTVFYNREGSVRDSIQSVLHQTLTDIEVVAVDDGSTDGTSARLREIGDSRLRVIEQENRGFVSAVCRAIEESTGEYVAVHGAGDVSLPDRLQTQKAFLDRNPDVGVVDCLVESRDLVLGRTRVDKRELPRVATETLLRSNSISHGEAMYRREEYERVGGYRSFFTYAQDRDLWLRMSLRTCFATIPRVLYRRYLRNDGVSTDPRRRLMQSYLSHFACQCLRERVRTGEDAVDLYGHLSAFMHVGDRQLGRRLGAVAMLALELGDFECARLAARLSVREGRTLKGDVLRMMMPVAERSEAVRRGVIRGLGAGSALRHRLPTRSSGEAKS